MKKVLLVAFVLMFGLSFQVLAAKDGQAQENGKAKSVQADKTVSVSPDSQNGDAIKANEKNKVKNQGENTQIQNQEQGAIEDEDATSEENKGQVNAESHRSAVATYVQSLLSVADREVGIGQQVKVIAQQQNDSKEKTAETIETIDSRNKLKTFLMGSDYKNLGALRSEMVKTENQIRQLEQLMVNTTNEQDKTELQNQIQAMKTEQTKINNFITQNENQFSLFGWAVKLFSK